MGLQSDIADGSLRGYEFRSLKHIVGDYYIAPRFLDAIGVHGPGCRKYPSTQTHCCRCYHGIGQYQASS